MDVRFISVFLYLGFALIRSQDEVVELVNCPAGDRIFKGYAEAGFNVGCTCRLKDGLNLGPGYVQWYNLTQFPVSTSSQTESTLEISPRRDTNETYDCVFTDTSGVQVGRGIRYQFDVFYGPLDGPGSVRLNRVDNVRDPDLFYMCPGEAPTFQCSFPMDLVKPAPIFKIHVFPENKEKERVLLVPSDQLTNDSVQYRYNYTFNPSTRGTFPIRCVVRNSVNFETVGQGALSQESPMKNIVVQGPPTSAPTINITINDGQPSKFSSNGTMQILENSRMNVTCEVKGGIPPVSFVNLTCGFRTNHGNGTSSKIEFDVTRNRSREDCSCTAEHISGCYRHWTDVRVEVVYETKIINFTVDSQIPTSRGMALSFECKAEGSPIPKMVLARERGTPRTLVIATDTSLKFPKTNIQCDDIDRYYCVAENGINQRKQKAIDVTVICPLELTNSELDNKQFEVSTGEDISIEFPVKGYPKPERFVLQTRQDPISKDVDRSKYNAAYITQGKSDAPTPYGTVQLTMLKVQSEDLAEYSLTINNGNGKDLVYNFKLNEAEETNILPIVIGAAVGGLVLLIIIIVVIVCCCKRRKLKDYLGNSLVGFGPSAASTSSPRGSLGQVNLILDPNKPRSRSGSQDTTVTEYSSIGRPSVDMNYPYAAVIREVNGVHMPVSTNTSGRSTDTTSISDYVQPIDSGYVVPSDRLYDTIPDDQRSTYTYAGVPTYQARPPPGFNPTHANSHQPPRNYR